MRIVRSITPSLTVFKTEALINDPGITYNEVGVIYNQVGLTYGGLYGYRDLPPIISLAKNIRPSIAGYADIYTNSMPPVNNGQVGPGWFLYVSR